jgi:hypothetical protein
MRKIPAGAAVTVKTATLGSYFLTVKGYGTIRAKRQN